MDSKLLDFDKCVNKIELKGVYYVNCKLGLFGCSGANQDQVLSEAFHYWQQYASDGEYSSIIGGESVIEKLISR